MVKNIKTAQDIRLFLVAVLASAFLLSLIPSPDFPLNDEWMFSRSVQNFMDTGVISCEGCTTSGVLLVGIGGVLSKIFGFSFDILRNAIMIFGSLSVGFMYLLLREVTGRAHISIFASVFLLANPIFYNISHLFITDIPFLFFVLVSAYSSIRGIRENNSKYFLISALASSAAIFLRQVAIAVPLAILIYFIVSDRRKLYNTPIILSIFLPVVLFGGFVLSQISENGQYYTQEFDVKNPIGVSREGFYNTWSTLIYFGFFFAPLSVISYRYVRNKTFLASLIFLSATAVLAYLLFSDVVPQANHMPYLINIMNENSLGTVTIQGVEGKSAYLPEAFWVLVTAASILASSVLSAEILSKVRDKKLGKHELFVILLLLTFLITVFLKAGGFFDRYIVVFIPLLAFVMVQRIRDSDILLKASVAYLIFLGAFSVIGTLDYIGWNEARWQAISDLQSQDVEKNQISGGFEYCLYNYGMAFQYEYWREVGIFDFEGTRPHDWKFCPGDDYVISFSQSPKDIESGRMYEVERTVGYCVAENFVCDEIYVLKAI